ncbi:MAG: hypothetical protein ACLR2E_20690 [Lachnospiraceae bacterium]
MIMVLAGWCLHGLWRRGSPGQDGGSALSAAFFPILLLMLLGAFHQQPGISEAGLVFGEYQEALGQLLKMFSVFGG